MSYALEHDCTPGRHADHRVASGEDGDHFAGAIGHHDFVGRDARPGPNALDDDFASDPYSLATRHLVERRKAEIGHPRPETFLLDVVQGLSEAFAQAHGLTIDPATVGSTS